MKLTAVELHSPNSSDIITLSLRDPTRLNPYTVTGITGLDADEIVPIYYGSPGGSTKFYDLTLKKRVVVLRISLNPRFGEDESYSSLRDDIYKLIASSRTGLVKLQLKEGSTVVAEISGFIVKNEGSLFVKEQEVQLTINCLDGALKAPSRVSVDVGPLDPAESLITDSLSTAPHGFRFEVAYTDAAVGLTIEDPDDSTWSFSINTSFLTGDHVFISSELNNKYAYLVRSAATYYIADAIVPGSVWPVIFPGDNTFALSNPTKVDWVSIEYYPTYWGV